MTSDPLYPQPDSPEEPKQSELPEIDAQLKAPASDDSLLDLRRALAEEAEAQKKLARRGGIGGFIDRVFHRSRPVEPELPPEHLAEELVDERLLTALTPEPEAAPSAPVELVEPQPDFTDDEFDLLQARLLLEQEQQKQKDLDAFLQESQTLGDWSAFEQPLPDESTPSVSPFDESPENAVFTESIDEPVESHPWEFTPEIEETPLLGTQPLVPGESGDLPAGQAIDTGEAAGEPTPTKKGGFFGRLLSPFRKQQEPSTYDVDDQIVTSRLSTSTLNEPSPDVLAGRKADQLTTPSTEEEPSLPAARSGVTAPFTAPLGEEQEDLPLSEDEFWERLTSRTDAYSPFDERDFREHAGMRADHTPLADLPQTSPFRLDEDALADLVPPDAPTEDEETDVKQSDALILDEDPRAKVLDPRSSAGVDGVITEEIRTVALEDYQQSLEEARAAEEEQAARPSTRLGQWLVANRIYLVVAVAALVVALLAITVGIPAVNRAIAANARPTANPGDLPYPVAIRLTGGWYINLQPGALKDGQWNPEDAEWLQGTELRRIIALPWSRQLEAVVRSMLPGDSISLYMSNNDLQDYTVSKVEQVDRSQVDILSGTGESLVVIVYEEGSDQRWVMLCEPK